MSGTENDSDGPVWYLARDGQQYGPVTELELKKLVELGQLLETDLVWNEGFTDWQPASVAIETYRPETPLPAQPEPPPQQPEAPPASPPPRQPEPAAQAPQRGEPNARPAGQDHQNTRPGPGADPGFGATRPSHRPAGPDHGPAAYANPASAHPQAPLQASPAAARRTDVDEEDDDGRDGRSGGFAFKAVAATVVMALLGGGGWFAYQNSDMIGSMVGVASQPGSEPPVVRAGRSDDVAPVQVTTQSVAPVNAAQRVAFLRSPVWEGVAQAFPDWASEKVDAATEMIRAGDNEQKVTGHLIGEFAKLRREHANAALAASPAVLRSVANAFLTNLRTLTGRSTEMCYEFISRGETSPQLLPLLADPQINQPLNKQMLTVVNAIADGRKNPQTYLPPRKSDYSLISNELNKMGWTGADMRLFGDPKQLAAAPPERVCKLVTDWFTAQLMISDQAIQSRLLVQSLRPVVAG